MLRARFAKIIATLGPASATPEMAAQLVEAGIDAFRINLAYEDPKSLKQHVALVRALEAQRGGPLGLIVDLEGPRFRIGAFAEGAVQLETGQPFRLDQSPELGDANRVTLPHPEAYARIKVGQRLLLDDGRLVLRVSDTSLFRIDTEVLVGGTLVSRKVIALSDLKPKRERLSAQDWADLTAMVELGVDWITLAWPSDAEEVARLRKATAGRVRLLARIDSKAVLARLDAVIEAADGLVIARGDLGYELTPEAIPAWQKDITLRCRRAGKPVIVAAQMLDSMVQAPAPTRAEASDVANAVFDGADAVMLSAETATGRYPLESVEIMDRIISEIEEEGAYWPLPPTDDLATASIARAIAASAARVAQDLKSAAIICHTSSGSTALAVASLRAQTPIICMSDEAATTRQLTLVWGLTCVHEAQLERWRDIVESSLVIAQRLDLAALGSTITITAGMPFGTSGTTNILRVARVDEPPPPLNA